MNICGKELFIKQAHPKKWFSGSIVIYRSLCLATKPNEIEKFEKKLKKSKLVIGESCYEDESKETIIIQFKNDYLSELERLKQASAIELSENCRSEIEKCNFEDLKIAENYNFANDASLNKTLDKRLIGLSIGGTESTFELGIRNLEEENLFFMSELDGHNESMKKEQYGRKYLEDRSHFVLRPVSFCYENQRIQTAYFTADTFSNGMITFRVIIPVEKQPMALIEERTISEYVENTVLPDLIEERVRNKKNFYSILENYIHEICETTGYDMFSSEAITHYIIAESSYKIKKFKRIKDQTKEDLFKILNAPYNHKNTLKEDTKTFFQDQVFGKDYVKTLISTKGECISICEGNKNVVTIENATEEELIAYRSIGAMHFSELSITIMTMINLNYKYTYNWLNAEKASNNVVHVFRKNLDYIYSLYEDCYGSVSKQIDFFKHAMKNYLAEEIYLNRIRCVQDNIKEKREQQVSSISAVVSFLTIFFTFLFGLPAIEETYTSIMYAMSENPENAKINMTVPFFIWFITVFVVLAVCGNAIIYKVKDWYFAKCYKFRLKYNADLTLVLRSMLKDWCISLRGFILFALALAFEAIMMI